MDHAFKLKLEKHCQQIFADMKAKRKAQPYWIVGLIGLSLSLLGMSRNMELGFWLICGTGGGLWYLYMAPYWHAQLVFKSLILPQVAKTISPDLSYSPSATFSDHLLSESRIIKASYNRFSAEDEFKGVWQDVDFGFREVRLTEVRGSGKNRRTVEVFTGIVMDFEYPKNFKTHTVIYQDRMESVVGGYVAGLLQDVGQSLSKMKRVQLEHPDFESRFQVLAEDETEARYILTPKKMELLISLTDEMGKNMSLAFYRDRMFVAMAFPNLDFNLRNPEALEEVIIRMEQVYGLIQRMIDLLDLDTTLYKAQS